jgi:hypothetical protein
MSKRLTIFMYIFSLLISGLLLTANHTVQQYDNDLQRFKREHEVAWSNVHIDPIFRQQLDSLMPILQKEFFDQIEPEHTQEMEDTLKLYLDLVDKIVRVNSNMPFFEHEETHSRVCFKVYIDGSYNFCYDYRYIDGQLYLLDIRPVNSLIRMYNMLCKE